MGRKRLLNPLRGWSDFFMTVAEVIFLNMRMYRLTRWIVDRHYADPKFRPGAKEFELAQIFERTGRIKEAEEHYQRAIQPGEVDGHLFLGDFYERQQQVESAIRTFETALLLAEDEPPLMNQLQERIATLRRTGDTSG